MAILALALGFGGPAAAAPGDTLFGDDFESGFGNWSQTNGPNNRAGVNNATSNSGSQSMYVGPGNSGGPPFRSNIVIVTLDDPIDLSSVADAEVEFWFRRGDDSFSEDTNSGDDFFVQFQRSDGSWTTIDAAAGAGTTGERLFHRFQLPPAALHADMKLRVANTAEDNDGKWHVDDVSVIETADQGAGQESPGFCEGFEGRLTRFNSRVSQTEEEFRRVGAGIHTSQKGSRSLFLRWDSVAFESRKVDLSSGKLARVRAWVRRGADSFSEYPESGENLLIEYYDGTSWNTLREFQGGGTAGEVFDVSLPVPQAGLTADFRVRVRHAGGDGADLDYWHVDELCVRQVIQTNYRMDEAAWTGSSGEVTDQTGNGHDGTGLDDATTDDSDPAIGGDPGTCGYGTFDGNDDAVEDPDAGGYLSGLDTVSVTAWVRNTAGVGNDNGIFATTAPSGKDNNLGLRYDAVGNNTGNSNALKASINTDACADGADCLQVETEGGLQTDGTWQHVALVWESGDKIRIFVDGNEVNTTVTSAGIGVHEGTLDAVDFLRAGRSEKSGSDDWQGNIDEFRVYSAALTQNEVDTIRQQTHPCPTFSVDHYEITHSGNLVSCVEESVTITAHDAGDNPLDPGNVTIDLSTTTGEGTWARVTSGSGTFNQGSTGDGAASYTFPGNGETSVTFDFNYTTVTQAEDPETVNIDVQDGSGRTEDPAEDPDLTVSRAGFVITDGGGSAGQTIPGQIAGKPSDTGPGDQSLGLQAVRTSDNDPTECEAAFPDGAAPGDVEVGLAGECKDPDTCAGKNLKVTNAGSTTSVDTNGTGSVTYTPVTLEFDSNAEADIVLEYPDAGEIQFHARYDPIDDSGDAPTVEAITGSSNAFVVRPFGFYLDFDGNGDGTFEDREVNATCDGQISCATGATDEDFATAGAGFGVEINAVVWEAADDDEGTEGVPDSNQQIKDNALTPNFGQEASAETVDLTRTLVEPSSGSNGTLSNATNVGGFTNGRTVASGVSWDEVGIIDLDANLSDNAYLGGADVTGTAPEVGRFIPARFALMATSVTNRADRSGLECGATTPMFTYIGERFDNDVELEAREAGGSVTTNYEGAFAFLDTQAELNLGATDGSAELTGSVNVRNLGSNWADGVGTFNLELDFGRTTPEGPYDPLRLGIAPDDDDNVTLASSDKDLDVDQDGTNDHAETGAVTLRFGRLLIESVAGSELAPIDQPVRAEYWSGDTWRTNDLDNCTALTLSSEIGLENDAGDTATGADSIAIGSGTTDITDGDPVELTNGTLELTFSAPGEGNTGWVETTGELDGAGADEHRYLRTDPEDDGTWQTNPAGTVTFGIYSGDPNWIHFRRVP